MESELEIDDIVLLKLASTEKSIVGTIAFIGKTDFSPGDWLGLILVPECRKFAKNNGCVKGKQYFNLLVTAPNTQEDNFGIFVRPDKVVGLSLEALVAIPDISYSTKLKLLLNHLTKLQFKFTNALSKLEMLQVEYDNVFFEKNEILSKYKELSINFQALESVKNNINSTNVEDQKIKLTIEQMKNDYQERETGFMQTIQLLKNDIAILQSKVQVNPDDSNKHILDELKRSEELIEKLTVQNTELMTRIEEAETLNRQLELQLEQQSVTIENLNQQNNGLTIDVQDLKLKLKTRQSELENEKAKYKSARKELKQLKQVNDYSSAGLYSKLIASLNSSSIQFANEIGNSLSKHKDLIHFYNTSLQLLGFTNILKDATESEIWNFISKQLDFIVHLLPYDTSHYLLEFKNSIDSINALILHYLEANDEMNDINLMITISANIPFDPNSDTLQNAFDKALYNRELAIFLLPQEEEKLKEELVLLRNEHYGIANTSVESILDSRKIDKVKLLQNPVWEHYEVVHPVEDTSEIDNLRTKVKVLQSKLVDEKKFQQELVDLHKKLRATDADRHHLETQLKQTLSHESQLQDQINEITVKLKKYGIDNASSVVDEYQVLEKRKLVETIDFQRSLLNKLTSNESQNYSLIPIERKRMYTSSVPTSTFRRIDKLFEINLTQLSTSKNSHSYKEQQLLEYLNLY